MGRGAVTGGRREPGGDGLRRNGEDRERGARNGAGRRRNHGGVLGGTRADAAAIAGPHRAAARVRRRRGLPLDHGRPAGDHEAQEEGYEHSHAPNVAGAGEAVKGAVRIGTAARAAGNRQRNGGKGMGAGVRAPLVGQASLPASSRGIPAPCSKLRQGLSAEETGGRDAARTGRQGCLPHSPGARGRCALRTDAPHHLVFLSHFQSHPSRA